LRKPSVDRADCVIEIRLSPVQYYHLVAFVPQAAPFQETGGPVVHYANLGAADNVAGWRIASHGHQRAPVRLLQAEFINAQDILQLALDVPLSIQVDCERRLPYFVFEGILPADDSANDLRPYAELHWVGLAEEALNEFVGEPGAASLILW
jgi:hypothetical protein